MKHHLLFFILFLPVMIFAEGFIAGTLVKTSAGYIPIEELRVHDKVLSYNFKDSYVESSVTHVTKKQIKEYIRILVGNELIGVAPNQKFYVPQQKRWVKAQNLSTETLPITYIDTINQEIDVYDISVADYHNFYVSSHDIVAHNAMPILLTLSWAFGEGIIEFEGAKIALAALGAYFGFSWFKNYNQPKISMSIDYDDTQQRSKKKNDQIIDEVSGSGGDPEPPDPDKNKKSVHQKSPEPTNNEEKDQEKKDEKKSVKTVNDLLKDAKPGRETSGRSKQFEKPGGYREAEKDFNDLGPSNIQNITDGKAGILPDGRHVNVRIKSSARKPTLEIIDKATEKRIKFRYGN